jgi:hypothetical protein
MLTAIELSSSRQLKKENNTNDRSRKSLRVWRVGEVVSPLSRKNYGTRLSLNWEILLRILNSRWLRQCLSSKIRKKSVQGVVCLADRVERISLISTLTTEATPLKFSTFSRSGRTRARQTLASFALNLVLETILAILLSLPRKKARKKQL